MDVVEVDVLLTVTSAVPLWPPLLAVMVAVPPATALTTPDALTVATAEFEVVQLNDAPLIVLPDPSLACALSCEV